MTKKHLSINELEVGKKYDTLNNPFPNHILHFIDNDGFLYIKDTIVKSDFLAHYTYNDVLKMVFIEN